MANGLVITGTSKLVQVANLELSANESHPNKMNFRGVLVRLDEPSTKPPNGSQGHRILVPSEVAKKRLSTLISMGLNYDPGLDAHNQRRKVGVIQKAWIDGKNLCVSGVIWKHDFPEAQKDLKRDKLGMSMEIGEVSVADDQAPIWTLTDFYFLGATILFRDKAAYEKTLAIAAKADMKGERKDMAATKTKKTAVKPKISVSQIGEALAASLKPQMKAQTEALSEQTAVLSELTKAITASLLAEKEEVDEMKTKKEKDEEACDTPEMKSARKKVSEDDDDEDDDDGDDEDDDEDDDDEMDSSVDEDIDEGDLEDMADGIEDDEDGDDHPGHLSKGAKNKGRKTDSEDKVGKRDDEGVQTSADLAQILSEFRALRKEVKASRLEKRQLMLENKKLSKRIKAQSKQMTAATEQMTRKSVGASPELQGLLTKVGLGPINASTEKFSVSDFDAILDNAHITDNQARVRLKNELRQAGRLDDGVVDRGFNRSMLMGS